MQICSKDAFQILDKNEPLYMNLQSARLLEIIRHKKVDDAIAFATNQMAPIAAENVCVFFQTLV